MNLNHVTIGNGDGVHTWAAIIRPGRPTEFVEVKNLGIHPACHGLHYGTGVLEGMQTRQAEAGHQHILFVPQHWARLMTSAVGIGIAREQTELPLDQFRDTLVELCQLNWNNLGKDAQGKTYPMYIRPLLFEDDCQLGVGSSSGWTCVIITRDKTPYLTTGSNGVTLWAPGHEHFCRPDQRCGNPTAKTVGNYTLGYRWKKLAAVHGAQEVLQFNLDGSIAETTGSNLFLVMPDYKVITPRLNGSILPGITRGHVIGLCNTFDIDVHELPVTPQMVAEARGCFITGTWTGVASVQKLLLGHPEPKVWRDFGQPSDLTRVLEEQFGLLCQNAKQLRGETECGWYTRLRV